MEFLRTRLDTKAAGHDFATGCEVFDVVTARLVAFTVTFELISQIRHEAGFENTIAHGVHICSVFRGLL
jgi:hypothetical protein